VAQERSGPQITRDHQEVAAGAKTAPGWLLIDTYASEPTLVRHIQGTSRRDLPASVENYRDLNSRSERVNPTFTMVRNLRALDPAYRPTHPTDGT
jgi:hypothetical protein